MEKLDLKQEYKELFKASPKQCQIVEVPEFQYIMIDGQGNPNNSPAFQQAVEALYGMAYTLKFQSKNTGQDFAVMPMEGTWWTEDMQDFSMERKEHWKYTLMIIVPSFITQTGFITARETLKKKKNQARLSNLRLQKDQDGLAVQILHIGPYEEEPPTIEKLHNFIADQGYRLHKRHREIYLSDARKTVPAKLKTILRQPVTRS